MQFGDPILLPNIPVHFADMEGTKGRNKVLREVQGDLGRILQACALEDLSLRVLDQKILASSCIVALEDLSLSVVQFSWVHCLC